MVTAARPEEHPLIADLLKEAHRFSFFQAVSLLERANPDAVPVGGDGPASREVVRFRPEVELGFPPSSMSAVELVETRGVYGEEESRYRITSFLMGLYGAQSPLPNHYAEDILREQISDSTVRDFLDIFHHRIYSLFYRAWQKYRYPVQFRGDGGDAFTRRFLAMIGLGTPEVQRATGLEPRRLLRYAGLLIQRPRSAAALQGFLGDWFDVPTRIEECVGRWVTIQPDDRPRLGLSGCRLGEDLVLGERAFDRRGQYQIAMGPLGYAAYEKLLPDGEDHSLLKSLTRFFVTDNLDFELELTLKGAEVPLLKLDTAQSARLGWTTWLNSGASPDVTAVFA